METTRVPARPRAWPSLLVAFGSLPALIAVGVFLGIAMVIAGVAAGRTSFEGAQEWIERFAASAPGFLALTLPGQLALLLLAAGAAVLSPTPWRARLGLRSPGLGLGGWVLVALGTLGMTMAVLLAGDLAIDEPSEHLEQISRVLSETRGVLGVVLLVTLSLVPGFAEELVFRGFVLTGLARAWPGWAAILVSGLAFAVLHVDPQHATLVVPLGLWLGYLAWTTRSVVTAMFGHALNNFVAIAIAQRFGDTELAEIAAPPVAYGAAGVLLVATVACALHLARHRRRTAAAGSEAGPEPALPPVEAPPAALSGPPDPAV